jgi:hypothetical protein
MCCDTANYRQLVDSYGISNQHHSRCRVAMAGAAAAPAGSAGSGNPIPACSSTPDTHKRPSKGIGRIRSLNLKCVLATSECCIMLREAR